MMESREMLKFPDLMPVDHLRHCLVYSNVLGRNADEIVTIDEIDGLQMDLETLLIAATGRIRKLQSEIQVLSDVDGKKEKKKEALDAKRMKAQEDRPAKKLKTSDSPGHVKNPNPGTSGSSVGKPKTKGTPVKIQEFKALEEQQLFPPTRVPVHEAPSKFWQSVEPYCQPIQHETIKILEQMYHSQQDNEEDMKIPELGVHFSERWAMEDLREEQSEGSRANVKKCDKSDDSVQKILKKASDAIEPAEATPFGSLTQRLISAFVEENIMLPPDSTATMIETGKSADKAVSKHDINGNPTKPPKPPSAVHAHKLENRIKLELIEQGILEPDDCDQNEDEILSELMSCQQELKAITKQNRDVLHQLLQVAREEMKKQEIRKKVESSNAEVMEHYRRVMSARQKKRTLMKKEKDAAWKALRDRDSLLKQLE